MSKGKGVRLPGVKLPASTKQVVPAKPFCGNQYTKAVKVK